MILERPSGSGVEWNNISLQCDLEFVERNNIRAASLQAGAVCIFTLQKQGVKTKSRCVGWRPGGAAPVEMTGQNPDPEAGLCIKTQVASVRDPAARHPLVHVYVHILQL